MALAILKHDGFVNGSHRFRAEIGGNRFYEYAIGDKKERVKRGGIPVLASPSYKSKLQSPPQDFRFGRFAFQVPSSHFGLPNRYIQLYSYRSKDGVGPAYSDIIPVPPSPGPPLAASFGRKEAKMNSHFDEYVDNVPFSHRKAPLASAMFIGSIMGALQNILPMAGPIVSKLFGGGGSKTDAKAGDPAKLIMELIKQLTQTKPTAKGLYMTEAAAAKAEDQAQRFAHAQVAPALLAALPALAPILGKVLSPETIKSVVGSISPNKLTGTVINGLKDFAKLGLQADKQEMDFIKAIHPSIDDPALDKLLMSMALGKYAAQNDIKYKRVQSVSLNIKGQTVKVHGRDRVVYRHGKDLAFQIELETPKRIGKAKVYLHIKDPETLKVLAKTRIMVEGLNPGPLPRLLQLKASRLHRLKANEEYLAAFTLVWKTKKGKVFGTSKSQLFTLAGDAVFDRCEDVVSTAVLDDSNKFRHFWHKLYQKSFTKKLRRVTFQCRYTYAFAGDRGNNARNPTITRIEQKKFHHDLGKLKSGMELSPDVLNRLLPLASNHPELDPGKIAALRATDFASRSNMAARGRVEIGAPVGESAALWAYPEFNLHNVVLLEPKSVDDNGRVGAMAETKVVFPVVSAVNLVVVATGAAASDSVGGKPGVFAGMKVISKQRIALYPVDLVKVDKSDEEDGEQ